jgi:hypothetical protein
MQCASCGEVIEGRPVWARGQRSFTCAYCGQRIEAAAVTVRRSPAREDSAWTLLWEELRRNAEFPALAGDD